MRKIKTYSKLKKEKGLTFIEKEFDETLKSHEVLIKVLNVSLCGTDLHIYNWDEWAQQRIK
ncbi:MAG: alcohol dehydrogenase catalytic domain-containing protein, partial [Acholeplasmataceae bacterium]